MSINWYVVEAAGINVVYERECESGVIRAEFSQDIYK